MNIKLKRYKKDFDYSYSFGVFPTIELLTHKPKSVIKVLLSSKGQRNEGFDRIKEICNTHRIQIEVADNLVIKLSSTENTYAVGVFRKYQSHIENNNHLVLVNPRDAGNLGTIIRTMTGFNINDLVIIKPAVDIFDPRTIRASMGAIFQVRFVYYNKFSEYQKKYSNSLYPFMTNGAMDLENISFKKPFSLIFGNESAGLDNSYLKIGTSTTVRQNSKIDSLNLSIAVAIGLYKSYVS